MTKRKTPIPQLVVRFTAEDRKLTLAIQNKLGVSAMSEVIRMALRTLAIKEGVSI